MKKFGIMTGLFCFGMVGLAYMNVPPEQRDNPTKEQKIGYAFFALLGGACMWKAASSQGSGGLRRAAAKGILDAVVLMWTPNNDAYKVKDLVANCCVIGRTGSGKSSGSGLALARGIVKVPHSGLLILASKPEDKEFWKGIFAKAGRSKDLLIFEPGDENGLRFNPIKFALKMGADARELTAMVMTVGETLKRSGKARGAGNEAFWESQKELALYNAIEIIRKATGSVSIPEVAGFIRDAAVTPEQTSDAAWRQGIHYRHLLAAYAAQKTPSEEHDYNQAFEYWTKEIPRQDPKVKSSVFSDIQGTLHILNSGAVRTALSEGTNVSPADLEQGKSILVNMPFHQNGASGIAVSAMWKLSAQKYLLKRRAGPKSSPIIIWCDEYQNVANAFDAAFLAECRSHLAGMVVLTQSIHSFHSSMGHGGGNDHETKALLANFTTKVLHAVDAETATFGSEAVGKDIQQRGSFSKNPCGEVWNEMMGQGSMSYSSREQVEEILLPRAFMHGLRTGGAANGFMVDGIVIKSGEPFAWGGNYLKVAFSQKG